jgi:general secretion pathway protein M
MRPSELPDGLVGRLLALGLTFVVLLLMWLAVANPLIRWYTGRAESLEQLRRVAHRMAEISAKLPDLEHRARVEASKGMAADALLGGSTDAISGAKLQEKLQSMADEAGATLSSAETLTPVHVAAYRRIGLHVSLSASYTGFIRVLQSIEQAKPRMLIDDLQVHGPRFLVRAGNLPVTADFTVLAFRGNEVVAQSSVR